MKSLFFPKIVPLIVWVISASWFCQPLRAQTSVRGPLLPEHNPPHKFQSFSEERWDASSFAPKDAAKWWQDARFGMFIHFGVASLKGVELGWGRQTRLKPDGGVGPIPDEIYDNLYKQFTIEKFDAAKWVELARQTGMKYIVVITKHHDGFHMWDTAYSDYKITKSPFGRDYLKELVDAARAAKMPIGFYFAQREWYHPQYDPRGAYPGRDHKKYVEYQFNAVRELLTKYGKIDILWFDAAWWGGMFKETDWDSERLYRMARELQPNILINNRASIPGDFDTPEQHVGGFQSHRPWESCVTLTCSWGYNPESPLKTPKQVMDLLIQCVTGDGNLMLNVGPMPTGEVAPREVEVLKVVGDWMGKFGGSVYRTRGGPLRNAAWGGTTYRGDTVFVHVLNWPGETLVLRPIEEKILSAKALTGGQVRFEQASKGIALTLPEKDRHPLNTVIALQLDRPVSRIYPGNGAASIFDGPGYGGLISGSATLETSSNETGKAAGFAVHTKSEARPWAVIDLGVSKNVKGVRITNPPGTAKANGLELLVSEDKVKWTSVWKAQADAPVWDVPVTRFAAGAHVPGVPARYLKVQLHPAKAAPLILRQVEVFGDSNAQHSTEASHERPLLFANYYCWYHGGLHPKRPFLHWTYPSSETSVLAKQAQKPGEPPPNSVFRPIVGLYDSADPMVAEWHVQLAKAAGIDAFLVDWWGAHNQLDQNVDRGIVAAVEKHGFKFALFDERAQFHQKFEDYQAMLASALKRYKDHPSYLRLDGRPVVYLYQVAAGPGLTAAEFPKLKQHVEGEVGPVYWIVDKISHDHNAGGDRDREKCIPADWLATPGVDSFGFYSTFSNFRAHDYDSLVGRYRYLTKLAHDAGKKMLLPVHPGHDNSHFAENPYVMPRRDGQTLRDYLRAATDAGADYIMVTSWNEWPESTVVEPSSSWADPYFYLKILAEWKGTTFSTPPLPEKVK